jgi:undecaprenyl-diphosphatase
MTRDWKQVLRLDSRILIAFLILAVTAFAFAKLASEVFEGDTMAFDRYLITALRNPADPSVPIGPRWFRSAMLDVTALGGVTGLTLLTMIVAGYLLIARKTATAVFLVVAIAGGALASSLLKLGFHRPRPDIVAHLVDVNTTSFPSGHAMNSAVVYLTLGALLARTHRLYRERIYILAVTMILTLGIGFSRVYLGVHWPSDVMAGWMVGGAWATLCSLVARWLQQRRTIEPNVPPPS